MKFIESDNFGYYLPLVIYILVLTLLLVIESKYSDTIIQMVGSIFGNIIAMLGVSWFNRKNTKDLIKSNTENVREQVKHSSWKPRREACDRICRNLKNLSNLELKHLPREDIAEDAKSYISFIRRDLENYIKIDAYMDNLDIIVKILRGDPEVEKGWEAAARYALNLSRKIEKERDNDPDNPCV